ncbi:Probable ureidoglycolate hydrolase [Olea europaea subsp. europaea]|uniref:Probable ureidoglycolate hydrolase n=1 Tax=Olea europaea subsp. europaea TaxID=158383 RepID=A0A8S0T3H0_OLEEU|nr:Probable ureidoglycolate hydrolase [Olea europaea subsp. europaea]
MSSLKVREDSMEKIEEAIDYVNDRLPWMITASQGICKPSGGLSQRVSEERSYSALIELKIEQGPILEEEATFSGVVTAITAPTTIKLDFEGNGDHTGAVLMSMRISPMGMIFIPFYEGYNHEPEAFASIEDITNCNMFSQVLESVDAYLKIVPRVYYIKTFM